MIGSSRCIVCQIGAREHYAVARTLHRAGLLAELITDVWVPPYSAARLVPGRTGERLRGRYHSDLREARVTHFTPASVGREVMKVAAKTRSQWDAIISQNQWFQAEAARHLAKSGPLVGIEEKAIVLAYSYAARDILVAARDAGASTVLCQIDGGEADEQLVETLWSSRLKPMPDKAPRAYWDAWREECRIADRIFVNSNWSRHLLTKAGVDYRKLAVIPVIYESEGTHPLAPHQYPEAFSAARPLKVLFLGALTMRKGVLEALEAARVLAEQPVHFVFTGANSEGHGALLGQQPNITWHEHVPRDRVSEFYRDADVFLFPTHSDGFGMTQIEALASGLPVISSRNCAAIVEHGRTGLLLEMVSVDAVVRAVRFCLDHPGKLAGMSVAALAAGAAFAHQSATTLLDALRGFVDSERQ